MNQMFFDSGEDDDGPTIFKRTNSSSKQSQLNSYPKKLSSPNNDGLSTKTSSSLHTSKDTSFGLKKDEAVSSSKISSERPKTAILKISASSGHKLNSSHQTKVPHSKKISVLPENSDDENPLSFKINASSGGKNTAVIQKIPKQPITSELPQKFSSQKIIDGLNGKERSPGNSDDEKPLSFKINASSGGKNSAVIQKVPKKPISSELPRNFSSQNLTDGLNGKERSLDSSDDEKPLSFKINASSVGKNSAVIQKVPKQPIVSELPQKISSQKITDGLNGKERSPDSSDDDKMLLSAKYSSSLTSLKSNSSLAEKASNQEFFEDSEDEKPLLSRLQTKPMGATSIKSESDEKPSSSKIVANGYAKMESADSFKHTKVSNKRLIDDSDSSFETSMKKAKVMASSVPNKPKQEMPIKKEQKLEDDDDIPISQRIKKPVSCNQVSAKKQIKKTTLFKKDGKKMKIQKNQKYSKSLTMPPGSGGGLKWTTLMHNGVIFPPPYKSHGIKMLYNGQPVDLTPEQEEVATMFAVMKDTDYATKPKFLENFMNDWRQILGKNHTIKKFELCDFTPIYEWHLREKEKKRQMSSEEKKQIKEEKLKQEEKYMWAIVDGVKEKVGNFRVEPPGLFRGRGEHPKMGKLKKRILPKDITINIGKDSQVPECPIHGERWKEVKHDNTVTWLAYWNDPINAKEFKYVFLAASSSLKGQSDKEKYEKARMLKKYIQNIRQNYTKDFTSKDATRRQIAVATYLIDKLALRAGNEKDDDEAETVGCCTLKVENVTLLPPNKLQFDFLGKDSIRYFNTVEVELAVYKAIGEYQTSKKSNGKKKEEGDDLFDLLDTSKLNAHLKELMPGLTAKVFRTYNASITLDVMLSKEAKDGNVSEKNAVYQIANKEVAIICNHQRTVSKSHEAQMSRLDEKINELKAQRKELEIDFSKAKKGKPLAKDEDGKLKKNLTPDLLAKKIAQFDDKIEKMELSKRTKEDLKTVALGTSKINYLDPRITVAWCKRNEVPIEKIFNKSLLAKFAWAMDVDPDFRF